MINKNKNDNAVSPVIGTILLIAITVILAAVVAAFAFGMTSNMSNGKTVAIKATRLNDTAVSVSNYGGANVADLNTISVEAGAATGTISTTVGSNKEFIAGTTPKRVLVVGTFSDGSQQILLDTSL